MAEPEGSAPPGNGGDTGAEGAAKAGSGDPAATGNGAGAGEGTPEQRIANLQRQISQKDTELAAAHRVIQLVGDAEGKPAATPAGPSEETVNKRIEQRIKQVGGVQTMREFVQEFVDLKMGPVTTAIQQLAFKLGNPDAAQLEPYSKEILKKMESGELTTDDIIGHAARSLMAEKTGKPLTGKPGTETRKPDDATRLGGTGAHAATSPGGEATATPSLYGKTAKERRSIMREKVVKAGDKIALEEFDRAYPIEG